MASKKLQKRIAAAERMEARAKQLALQADLARKAIGAAHRAERTSELCDIGGDALSVGLGKLSPAERYGAFMFIADMMESEVFLAECRRRSAAEMARREKAREAYKEQKRRKRPKPDAAATTDSTPAGTVATLTKPAGAAQPEEPEALVVRFSGPITGLGRRLQNLGLTYDNKKVEWHGEAPRAAVEAEIAASEFSHLLIGITSGTGPGAGAAKQTATSRTVASGAGGKCDSVNDGDVELEN